VLLGDVAAHGLDPRHEAKYRRLGAVRPSRDFRAQYHRAMADLRVLDADVAPAVEHVCEAIVPGSARVQPAVYVDALLARMDDGRRQAALAAFATVAADVEASAGTPDFLMVRALAIEAFYSDFVAPGVDAQGAWTEIDFNSPLATRLVKDWSYLGIA